jgi:cytochrome P450
VNSPSPLLPKIRTLFEGGTNAFTSVLMGFLPECFFPILRRQKEAVQQIRDACRKIIEQRFIEAKSTSTAVTQRDLLGLLVGCKDDKGESMPMEQIIDEAMAFLLAGHETTSTLMTWLLYALAINSEVDAKVYKELEEHAVVIKDRAPTHTDLRELPYMLMTIEETCRLYPPIPLLARQARDQDNFLQLRNQQLFVPRGGMVMLNTLGVHRDERFWKEPLVFRPERFARGKVVTSPKSTKPKSPKTPKTTLSSSFSSSTTSSSSAPLSSPKSAPLSPKSPRRNGKYNWMPFSTGPRHCIGQEFAMLEIRSLLSQILVRYRFTLAPGHPPVKPKAFSLVVLRPSTRIMMCVERR